MHNYACTKIESNHVRDDNVDDMYERTATSLCRGESFTVRNPKRTRLRSVASTVDPRLSEPRLTSIIRTLDYPNLQMQTMSEFKVQEFNYS